MPRNNCQKCRDFDIQTKKLMTQLFGDMEIKFLAFITAGNLAQTLNAKPQNKEQFIAINTAKDQQSLTLGKFMISMSEIEQAAMKKQIRHSFKMDLNITDEACPHVAGIQT